MKRESEKLQLLINANPDQYPEGKSIDLTSCFLVDEDGNNARYETRCIDDYVSNLGAGDSKSESDVTSTESESESDVESDSEGSSETDSAVETVTETQAETESGSDSVADNSEEESNSEL